MRNLILLTALFFLASSCGTTSVNFSVKRPAPVSLKGYKNVAVGDFTGRNEDHANAAGADLEKALLETGYFDKVMDRKNLDLLLNEQKLQLAGLIDRKDYNRIGKISGAKVLITGSVDNDRYREQVSDRLIVKTNTDTEKRFNGISNDIITRVSVQKNREFTRTGVYSLSVSYQIMDMETAELIAVKRFSVQREAKTVETDGRPAMIDQDQLFYGCLTETSMSLVRQIVPYNETVRADFQTDNDLPEIEKAVSLIRSGDSDKGLKIFVQMTNQPGLKPEKMAKTYYNLGLMQSFYKNFHDARINVTRALELNPREYLYENALNMIGREEASYRQLKDQE